MFEVLALLRQGFVYSRIIVPYTASLRIVLRCPIVFIAPICEAICEAKEVFIPFVRLLCFLKPVLNMLDDLRIPGVLLRILLPSLCRRQRRY